MRSSARRHDRRDGRHKPLHSRGKRRHGPGRRHHHPRRLHLLVLGRQRRPRGEGARGLLLPGRPAHLEVAASSRRLRARPSDEPPRRLLLGAHRRETRRRERRSAADHRPARPVRHGGGARGCRPREPDRRAARCAAGACVCLRLRRRDGSSGGRNREREAVARRHRALRDALERARRLSARHGGEVQPQRSNHERARDVSGAARSPLGLVAVHRRGPGRRRPAPTAAPPLQCVPRPREQDADVARRVAERHARARDRTTTHSSAPTGRASSISRRCGFGPTTCRSAGRCPAAAFRGS